MSIGNSRFILRCNDIEIYESFAFAGKFCFPKEKEKLNGPLGVIHRFKYTPDEKVGLSI